MAITKQQRDYAKGRIEQVFADKYAALRNEHYTEETRPTTEEKAKLLAEGKVPLREVSAGYRTLEGWFDFSSFVVKGGWTKEGERLDKELQKEKQHALDSLMLGDAKEALEIIKEFCKD